MHRRDNDRPFAAMPYVFGMIATLALACRFAVGWKENGSVDYQTYLYPTHLRIDGLMFGVLLSYYNRFRPRRYLSGSLHGEVAGSLSLRRLSLLSTFPLENRNMHTWGLTVIYLAAGFLVAKAIAFEGPGLIRVMSGLLARIGIYSYSIYLWHTLFHSLLLHFHFASPALSFWCYFAGAILFGIAAAKLIEIPVLRFRDRVFPRSSSTIPKNRPLTEEPENA